VNGHNRLAKARQLGIPTVRTRELLAGTDSQARALGAIDNIASGGGTAFDAAKYIREAGITTPEQLEAAGIPLNSGTGAQGLALSRLPDTLFQQAINGELPLGRALKLGGSDLDPETMIRVAQMGESKNVSERGFQELVDMAGTAPKVESDQIGLFGAEMVDTMTIKAELAAKVKADLTSNKNLMAKVSKKQSQQQLSEVGTTVNVDAAQVRRQLVAGLVDQFDADKYMTGTAISQLLNEGTEQIANGAKRNVIAKRITQQLSTAAENSPPAPKVDDTAATAATPEPEVDAPMTGAERDQLKRRVIKRAIDNGEVRPSESPLPDLPEPPRDLNNPQQLIEDELRLADEYARQQDLNDFDAEQARRQAIGYDDMPLEERKAEGMLDGWEEEPADTAATAVTFEMPADVAKSAPRFGSARLRFQSDLDRAAYIIRSKAKKSKGEDRIVAALNEQGFNIGEVRDLGNEIKNMIQDAIQEQTGSRRAPQGLDIEIEVPASTRDSEALQPTAEGNARAEMEDNVKAAMRPVSIKTENRLEGAAQAYAKWTGTPIGTARYEVGYTRQVLDPDKVKGLDMDKARNDQAMGRTSPETEAVAEAYRIAYKGKGSTGVDYSVPPTEILSWIDGPHLSSYRMSRSALLNSLEGIVERVSGTPKDGVEFRFQKEYADLTNSGHNIKGVRKVEGWYNSINDAIVIADALGRNGDELTSTAFHEAWHRIQYRFLSQKDMNILDSAWGRSKVLALTEGRPRAFIEQQAIAFENYASIRGTSKLSSNPSSLKEAFALKALEQLDEQFPLPGGRKFKDSFRGKALKILAELFHEAWELVDRLNNLRNGNGYRTVYDMFEDAYQGTFRPRRKNIDMDLMQADLAVARGDEGLPITAADTAAIRRSSDRLQRIEEWRVNPRGVAQQIDARIAELKKTALNGGC